MLLLATMAIIISALEALRFITPSLCGFTIPSYCIAEAVLFTLLLAVVITPDLRFKRILAILCVEMAFSNMVNKPAVFFESYPRLGFFVLMIAFLSPLIGNQQLKTARHVAWKALIVGLLVLLYVSFILYIGYLIEIAPSSLYSFRGLAGHGNMMGVICAFSLILSFWQLCSSNKITWRLIFWALTLLIALLMLISTGSRSSNLGTVVAIIVISCLTINRQTVYKIGGIMAGMVLIVVAEVSFGGAKAIIHKNEIARNNNSLTYSRDNLWADRLEEFKESPILGIGFAAATHSTPYVYTNDNNSYVESAIDNPITDNVEPGSSWLSLLSNTGLCGALLFLWFMFELSKKLWRSYKIKIVESIFYIGLLAFLIVQGCFEGWLLYGGSLTFFIFWLLTSRIDNLKPVS